MARDRILIVDDEEGIRETLSGILEDDGYTVYALSSGEEALSKLSEINPDIVFLDIWLAGMSGLDTLTKIKDINSDIPIIMISGHGNIEIAVNAIKNGAYDFLEKPLSLEKVLLVTSRAIEKKRLREENKNLKNYVMSQNVLIGSSQIMQNLKEQIALAAQSNSRVLILGESGTGKEIVARLLHEKGLRAGYPFVEVNCAAIPQELIESELFGHEKGAFTGASEKKIGKFELADKGTLFLDEIGDMSLQTQAKVLRVIETQFFQRVGGSKNISVDVRIIAATNKNLIDEVRQNRFREDLYFRLNVIPLQMPTLREKRDDIPELIDYFINKFSSENGLRAKSFSKDLVKKFKGYDWPGNIRELKNTVERLLIMVPNEVITVKDAERLGVCVDNIHDKDGHFFSYSTLKEARDSFEAEYIRRKLKEHNWNISKTADAIDVERSSLHKKIKALNIVEHND